MPEMHDRLGLAPSASGEPPPPDPEWLAPLIPGDEFFKTLPRRPRPRPSALAIALLLHALALGALVWGERDRLRELNRQVAEMKNALAGRPGAPGERGVPVMIVPRLPPAPRRAAPRANAPAASAPASPQPESDLGRRYTHVIQEEQPEKPPVNKSLFSDRDRRGASPLTPTKPDPRNPDPASQGRDARRMGISAPGPDRPGEPGAEKPALEDKAGGGQNGKNGQNGENGTGKPPGGRVAFGRAGAIYAPGPVIGGTERGTIRSGRPDSSSAPAGNPRGGATRDPAKGLSADPDGSKKSGAPGATGKPGEGTGDAPDSIRAQLSALARSGRADLYRNPNGAPFKTGAFSFDTQGYDLGDYDRKMHQAVEREWNPPSVPIQLNVAGCTLLNFTIERSGRVSAVELVNTSGTPSYDQAAMDALKNARLPPLPDKMALERLTGRSAFFINLPESDHCGTPIKPGARDEGIGPGP